MHLYMHVGKEMLWQKSGIYNAESFNSQQNASFDIKWLTYVFCITVNISFNVCAQVAWIYIQRNPSLFQMQMPCVCSIHHIQVIS